MSYPNNQIDNLLTEIQTILSTYEPSGYFSTAKYFHASEDEINLDQSQKDEAQGKNSVVYLIPSEAKIDESFYEDFRIYTVEILFKFNESNIPLARRKKRRILDNIRDIMWRQKNKQPVATYFYNVDQVGGDNENPSVSDETLKMDGTLEKNGRKIIHRVSQTWNFYTCIDHQTIDLSTIKSGTVTAGERI
jgi:hypothetical protein